MDLPRRLRACAVTTVTAASPSWRGAERVRVAGGRSLIGYAVFPSRTLDMASVGTILVSWNPAA